jgi:ABC-type Na+ efflux pump permease subunit
VRHFAPVWAAHLGFFNSEFLWIWMVAPVVVGCVAVAEERRWNTLEGFLCLPARKRSQFLVKFAVVMTLGTALGGVLPSVLEYIGGGNGEWSAFDGWSTPFEALSTLVLFAAGVTTVSFFASTMSRGMLQGVTVALSAIILSRLTYGLLFEMLERLHLGVIISGNGFRLFPTLVWPAMLIAYFWLAFRNFTSLQTGWRLWARNYLWLAAVFASVLLAAVAISRLLLFL